MIGELTLFLFGSMANAALETPFLASGGTKPISVTVGHADPLWYDLTGDGLPDLLVGEFGGGTLRLYPNIGSLGSPKFDKFEFVQAGGSAAKVETG